MSVADRSLKERMTRGLALVRQDDRVEAALWRRSKFEQDQSASIRLFETYEGLAKGIARAEFAKRKSLGFEFAEVQQSAFEGLMQAIDRFDAKLGVPFPAFARRRIRGNVIDTLSRSRESAAQYSHRQRLERERLQSLRTTSATGSSPLQELSALTRLLAIGLLIEDCATREVEEIASEETSAYDTLAWNEMQRRLTTLLNELPERERFVISQHYQNEVSFTQIADALGLTKGRISQIHKAVLLRLRSELEKFL